MLKNGKATMRERELGRAKVAGYHGEGLARVLIERQTASYAALMAAANEGARLKANGFVCECFHCKRA